jgi:hypothetical protein
MANSIINFKNGFNGGSRANRFTVFPSWPQGVNIAANDHYFKIVSASLPTLTVNSISVPYRGRLLNFAGDRQYSPWVVGVYDDGNSANIWSALQKWKDLMDGHFTHTVAGDDYSYNSLQTTWRIHQYDVNGVTPIRDITLYKCWPSVIGEIGLNMSDNNLVSFPVTLTFDNVVINRY